MAIRAGAQSAMPIGSRLPSWASMAPGDASPLSRTALSISVRIWSFSRNNSPKAWSAAPAPVTSPENDDVQQISQTRQRAPFFPAQPALIGQIRQDEDQEERYEEYYNQQALRHSRTYTWPA